MLTPAPHIVFLNFSFEIDVTYLSIADLPNAYVVLGSSYIVLSIFQKLASLISCGTRNNHLLLFFVKFCRTSSIGQGCKCNGGVLVLSWKVSWKKHFVLVVNWWRVIKRLTSSDRYSICLLYQVYATFWVTFYCKFVKRFSYSHKIFIVKKWA